MVMVMVVNMSLVSDMETVSVKETRKMLVVGKRDSDGDGDGNSEGEGEGEGDGDGDGDGDCVIPCTRCPDLHLLQTSSFVSLRESSWPKSRQ